MEHGRGAEYGGKKAWCKMEVSALKGNLGRLVNRCYFCGMSLAEIQAQAAALSPEDRRELAAFLTVLRMKETGEWENLTSEKSESRESWISLEEAT